MTEAVKAADILKNFDKKKKKKKVDKQKAGFVCPSCAHKWSKMVKIPINPAEVNEDCPKCPNNNVRMIIEGV